MYDFDLIELPSAVNNVIDYLIDLDTDSFVDAIQANHICHRVSENLLNVIVFCNELDYFNEIDSHNTSLEPLNDWEVISVCEYVGTMKDVVCNIVDDHTFHIESEKIYLSEILKYLVNAHFNMTCLSKL